MVLAVHEVKPCVYRPAVDCAHDLLAGGRPLTSARSLRLVKALQKRHECYLKIGYTCATEDGEGGGACPVEDTKSTAWNNTETLYKEMMDIGATIAKTT